MHTSEARILANRKNAQHSTGPKTEAGKAASRANAYKHGMTGAGVVMPEEDAAEVERLAREIQAEMKPPGEVGKLLVRKLAMHFVKGQRCQAQESAATSERVRRVMAEFVPPEGVDEATARRFRAEAGNIALFDPGKEASQARRYEAAADRGFYQSLKELRQLIRDEKAADPAVEAAKASSEASRALGSFSQATKTYQKFEARRPEPTDRAPSNRLAPLPSPLPATDRGVFDVPLTIGRRP